MSTEAARSRRAILLAAAGGTAAVVADSIARPGSVIAGPTPIYRNQYNQPVTMTTGVNNATNGQDVFTANSQANGTAFLGYSVSGVGVSGTSGGGEDGVIGTSDSGRGVHGASNSGYGVFGESGGSVAIHGEHLASGVGVEGTSASGPGILGFSSSKAGVKGTGRIGLQGDAGPTQTAVHGFVGSTAAPLPPTGVGVVAQAQSASLVALHVKGRAKFDRSGVVTVASGTSSVTKTLAGVTTTSLVLAVLGQDRAGVWVRAAVPSAGKFKVILNKNVSRATKVTYIVLG
jgi:hypothetical protein